MRFETYNHEENACRIGLALAIIAVVLNAISLYSFADNRLASLVGVFCAIVSMLAAYLSESYCPYPQFSTYCYRLQIGCIALCVISYAVWIASCFLLFSA